MEKGNQSHDPQDAESRNAEYLDNADASRRRFEKLVDTIALRRRSEKWLALQKRDGMALESEDAASPDWSGMPRVAKNFHISGFVEDIDDEDALDGGVHPGGESEFENFDGVPAL